MDNKDNKQDAHIQGIVATGAQDKIEVPDVSSDELNLGDKIGGGCFGTVYKGVCRGKTVAIKLLHKQELESATMAEFKKEVAILTHLRHPNVVLFMGACTEPHKMAIVTEFMKNGDVHKLVHNPNNKLSIVRLLSMARDVSQGMNWLHCSKPPIIHRDLKPTNLLVDENWTVKICDFGLSAFQTKSTMKDHGVAPGTPLWMSPEVLQGKVLNEKTDVYSFAIVLWEMLTGKEPFEEHSSYEVFVHAVCVKDERPPLADDLHPSLKSLLTECWQKTPDKRPSFGQITERLEAAMIEATFVQDPVSAAIWKKNFNGQLSVLWTKFSVAFYNGINEPLLRDRENSANYKCLRNLIAEGEVNDSQTVSLERFGMFSKWFGPVKGNERTILDNISTIMECPWFHGDVTKQQCESLLINFKKGYWMVRLSNTEPDKTPFTLSKVNKSGKVDHQRIYVASGSKGYYSHIKFKSGTKKIEAPSLISLMKKLKTELKLKTACPGSKYRQIFESNTGGAYLPSPEDDDDDE